jgi:hypothetical protein
MTPSRGLGRPLTAGRRRLRASVVVAAAGESGHAPLKRSNGGQAIAPRFSSALASRGREGSPHHASQPFAPGSIRVAGDSGSAPATTNAAERPNPIERCRTIDASVYIIRSGTNCRLSKAQLGPIFPQFRRRKCLMLTSADVKSS